MSEPPQPEFQDKSDAELFALLKKGSRSTPAVNAAFAEFYRRYADRVKRFAWAFHRAVLKGGEDDADEFVLLVFERFWQFSLPAFNPTLATTSEELTKLVLFWLKDACDKVHQQWRATHYPLSHRRLDVSTATKLDRELDACSRSGAESLLDAMVAAEEISLPNLNCTALENALQKLKQCDRDVLLACYRYYSIERKRCLMDASVRARLCVELGATWATVRKRKQRAEESLQKLLLKRAQVA